MLKITLLLFLATLTVFAKEYYSEIGREYCISPLLLKSIARTESKQKKYVIGTTIKNNIKRKYIVLWLKKIKCNYNKNKHRLYISPKNLTLARKAVAILDYYNVNYDVGLFQINSYNIKKRKWDIILLLENEYYNTEAGATILSECATYNKGNLNDTLECYNKGTNKKLYNGSYSKKVIREYQKLVRK